MDTIHLAYALDDKFAEITCVSIRSVLQHCNRNIVFYIFESGLSIDNKSKMQSTVASFPNAEIRFCCKELDRSVFIDSPQVPKETYIEALLPELLPDLSHIIWLDGDIILEKDIAILWEINLGESYAAMAPDYPLEDLTLRKAILGINANETYYNTGVALLDLQKLRKVNFTDRMLDSIERLHYALVGVGLNWYRVQDTMNFLLRGKVLRLPVKYNSFFWQSLPIDEPLDNCMEEILDPIAVHLISNPKPTMLGGYPINSAEWERYYNYKRLTPFSQSNDEERVAKYKNREDNTMNGLAMYDVARFTRYFAPRLFKTTLDIIKKRAVNRRITVWGLNDLTWNLVAYLSAYGVLVEHVVDGLSTNQGIKIFHYIVESPDILQNYKDDKFVLLDMRSESIAEIVKQQLLDWNYIDEDFYYVYLPVWA